MIIIFFINLSLVISCSGGGKCDVTNFWQILICIPTWRTSSPEFYIRQNIGQLHTERKSLKTKRYTITRIPSIQACGGADVKNSLIQNGKPAERDHFSWTVATFCRNDDQVLFCSTGTLVSLKHVDTNAAVVRDDQNGWIHK